MSDIDQEALLYLSLQRSPLLFIDKMWGLKPQPLKEQYRDIVKYIDLPDVPPESFEKYNRGDHLTFQQFLILSAVERAIKKAPSQGGGYTSTEGGGGSKILGNKNFPKRISVASGHGIGKSTVLSWLLLWFLFCYPDAQIPCTAPTGDQLYDVLWKEVSKWLNLMPKQYRDFYEWQSNYIRMKESPATWFARARTAKKESPEALAGIHGDHVMMLVDEASGVPDEVFTTAEGALTGENILVILISNPTRNYGYFYNTQHKNKQYWQCFSFSSEDSPIVEHEYVENIIRDHGKDSDEYRIRVLGKFPREDAIDDKGYVPLLFQGEIQWTSDTKFVKGFRRLGVDPSGEGEDYTIWVLRDTFKAQIIGREAISTPKSIASKTNTLITQYGLSGSDIYVDNFGKGANVAQELGLLGIRVNALNIGEKALRDDIYLNLRAELYWRFREWLKKGGMLVNDADHLFEEAYRIKYRREVNGKLRIMSKREMAKEGIGSPDAVDALIMTFYHQDRRKITDFITKSMARPISIHQKIATSTY